MFLPQINRLQPPRPPLSLQLRQVRNLSLMRTRISMNRKKRKRNRNKKRKRILQLHRFRPLRVQFLLQRLHRRPALPRCQPPRLHRTLRCLLKLSYCTQILLIIATPGKSKPEIRPVPMFSMVQAAGISLLT